MTTAERNVPDTTAWVKSITEGFDGRVSIQRAEDEEKSYFLHFEIREQREPDHESLVMEGTLKWDGCIDVFFVHSRENNCMTHFCWEDDLERFMDTLRWVWLQGAECMPETWDAGVEKTIVIGETKHYGPCSVTGCRGMGMVATQVGDLEIHVCGKHSRQIEKVLKIDDDGICQECGGMLDAHGECHDTPCEVRRYEDAADGAEAERRLSEEGDQAIPYSEARKKLGLEDGDGE